MLISDTLDRKMAKIYTVYNQCQCQSQIFSVVKTV